MTSSLIFDMDGTLFQTNTILELALENTFNHLRSLELWEKETPIEKYREIMGVTLPVVWENLLPEIEISKVQGRHREIFKSQNHTRVSKVKSFKSQHELHKSQIQVHELQDQVMEIRNLANDFFHEQLITQINQGKGALYPHVETVFRYLKDKKYSIYIASNGQVEYLNAIVSFYKLNEWITETFSIQQVQSGDKADLVSTILKKYDIHKGAVIGDRLSDIHAAKKNGLTAIGCNFDFAQQDELIQADIVIDDLLELKRIFV